VGKRKEKGESERRQTRTKRKGTATGTVHLQVTWHFTCTAHLILAISPQNVVISIVHTRKLLRDVHSSLISGTAPKSQVLPSPSCHPIFVFS
jgi:hypothetical protein